MRAFSYFRSRHKDDGHTIGSAIAENHMLHVNYAKFTTLCITQPELLPIESFTLRE